MAITYSPSSNLITVTGYSETTPCTFDDIYNADKAGTLVLIDRDGITATDTNPVDNTYNLRPADEKLMGGEKHDLWITVENWSGFTDVTIRLIGTDEAGNSLTEDIIVTGNGTYYASELFKTLTQTQVVAVTGSGSFDYELIQGQWGVVSKQGDTQYYFTCKLQIGDGSTETWFEDTGKQVTFADGVISADWEYLLRKQNYGNVNLTDCLLVSLETTHPHRFISEYQSYTGTLELYRCYVYSKIRADITVDIFDYSTATGKIDLGVEQEGVQVTFIPSESKQFSTFDGATYDRLYINGAYLRTPYHVDGTIRNLYMINNGMTADYSPNLYLIDAEIENWEFGWQYPPQTVYRQYTFNPIIVDKDGNPIVNALVRLYDKNNNLVFEDTTNENGRITLREVTYKTYSYDGTTETIEELSPHKLVITKDGYATYEANITIDHPIIDDVFVLDALTYTYDDIINELQKHDKKMTAFKFM